MSFSLPNPTVPTNGNPLDASPILANFLAIQAAIDSFDGSQLQAKSITEQALADAINPRLRGLETISNFVYTGCVWSATSGLAGTMSGGTVYVNGYRTIVNAVGSNTFPASADTYVDIDYLGNITYNSVSNGSAAPSLTANSIRVAKVITGSSSISSVSIFGADSLGNIIYPVGSSSAAKMQNPYAFSVYRNAALTPGVDVNVVFDTIDFDIGINYSVSTGKFTAPINGIYHFDAMVAVSGSPTSFFMAALIKNSTVWKYGNTANSASQANPQGNVGDTLELNAGDTVSIQVHAGSSLALAPTRNQTYFSGYLVSAGA